MMKFLKSGILLAIIAVAITACSSDNDGPTETNDNFDRGAMLANWADNIIIPAYTSFNSKVVEMEAATAAFNAAPTVENLQSLRAAWKVAYVSRMKYSHLKRFKHYICVPDNHRY